MEHLEKENRKANVSDLFYFFDETDEQRSAQEIFKLIITRN